MTTGKEATILLAARSVFMRYGFKRVNMTDIAEAAGMSRPSLYGVFKSKEEIFICVFRAWLEETIALIESEMAAVSDPEEKLDRAFEIWVVRPFEMMMISAEVRELLECRFDFAQEALEQGYKKFEATIAPVLTIVCDGNGSAVRVAPERLAHLLTSAARGFKLTANTPDEMRLLIKELLILSLR